MTVEYRQWWTSGSWALSASAFWAITLMTPALGFGSIFPVEVVALALMAVAWLVWTHRVRFRISDEGLTFIDQVGWPRWRTSFAAWKDIRQIAVSSGNRVVIYLADGSRHVAPLPVASRKGRRFAERFDVLWQRYLATLDPQDAAAAQAEYEKTPFTLREGVFASFAIAVFLVLLAAVGMIPFGPLAKEPERDICALVGEAKVRQILPGAVRSEGSGCRYKAKDEFLGLDLSAYDLVFAWRLLGEQKQEEQHDEVIHSVKNGYTWADVSGGQSEAKVVLRQGGYLLDVHLTLSGQPPAVVLQRAYTLARSIAGELEARS